MKFAQQIRQGAVEEWRRAYIDYRLLKKLIKAAAKSAEEPGQDDAEGGTDAEASQAINLPSSPDSRYQSPSPAPSEELRSPPPTLPTAPAPTLQRRDRDSRVTRVQSRGSGHSDTGGLRKRKNSRPGSLREPRWRYSPDIPLEELIPMVTPQERKFFQVLDGELDKVQAFYEERETEAINRYKVLTEQLDQLAEHRQKYLEAHSKTSRLVQPIVRQTPYSLRKRMAGKVSGKGDDVAASDSDPASPTVSRANEDAAKRHSAMHSGFHSGFNHVDPESYVNARRKLKVAMWEFYRFLGYVKNYRLLNRTGFSKVTKKMEKVTRIKCQGDYTAKVSKTHFATSTVVDDLQNQTETLFGVNFEKGSRKKAVQRLRFMGAVTTHHFASWRAGILLGLAMPPLIEGLVRASQADVQARIPSYPTLLQIYGSFLLPVLLAWGVGVNLVVWTRAHINIPLVFYFDTRTHLDYRLFLEIPSLLLCTLAYCFWLSFTVNSATISPQVWPVVWLFSTILFLFNPLPYFQANARWWLIRSTFRVFTSGLFRVQFRDFWLGDQFCSLYYTSYNLGLIVCSYTHYFRDVNSVCSTNSTWASAILASLPYIWRLGQSFRRYNDAREVKTHLVNAGKYAASIIYLFLYFSYRIKGSNKDATFVLFIVFATINSIYSVTWDVLMDWNLFKRDSKLPFLRKELAYRNNIWFYYFALVTNFIGRFTWIIYILPGTNVRLKGFIVALIETARRFQWNFLRVESEHVGNVDGFRVTRDVPLPYTIPTSAGSGAASVMSAEHVHDDEDDDDTPRGEHFKPAEGTDHELGQRVSKFPRLLPGEVGKRLKAAVLGRKGLLHDESDDEEDSPVTDTQEGSGNASQRDNGNNDEGLPSTKTASSSRNTLHNERVPRQAQRNYNTFGWESDNDQSRSRPTGHETA